MKLSEFKNRYFQILIFLIIGLILVFIGISIFFKPRDYFSDVLGISLTLTGLLVILLVIGGSPIQIKHPRLFYLLILLLMISIVLWVFAVKYRYLPNPRYCFFPFDCVVDGDGCSAVNRYSYTKNELMCNFEVPPIACCNNHQCSISCE
jgi:vacuolar-type H+-ATPase subunit I/STV1